MADNLRVKEVWVPARAAGERAERFTVCHNPEQAQRDQLVRQRLVAHLEGLIEGPDAWPKRKRDEPNRRGSFDFTIQADTTS